MRIAAGNNRALVPTVDPVPMDGNPLYWPASLFLTQLLATKNALPQTRLRRGVDPSDATAVYEAQAPHKSYRHQLWREL